MQKNCPFVSKLERMLHPVSKVALVYRLSPLDSNLVSD
jgi:hypothetical protein